MKPGRVARDGRGRPRVRHRGGHMSENANGSAPEDAGILRSDRRRFLTGTALAAGATLAGGGRVRRSRAADRAEVTFASARFFGKSAVADLIEAYNSSQGKVHVTYVELPPPSQSTEVHQALVQQLARRSGTPDVFTQDVIWIAEFAGAGWALPLDSHIDAKAQAQYFPGVIKACTWQGKLTALPWFIDSGMLYYRTDLLEKAGAKVPETWDELVATAQKLQGSGDAKYGYLWQGKQAEVLVCDLVEMIGSNGGSILGPDGKQVLLADDKAVEAVQFMHDTIDKLKISPADVLSWYEEPSRRPSPAARRPSCATGPTSGPWPRTRASPRSSARSAWHPCPTSPAARARPASAATSSASTPPPRTGTRRSTSRPGCPRPRRSSRSPRSRAWRRRVRT